MRKQHVVVLSEPERARLHTLIGQGVAPARALTHARILLKANQGEAGPGWTDRAIATALEVHHTTVARVRQQYAAGAWTRPWTARRRIASTAASWMASRRRTWSRWRAVPRPRVASAGRCGYWPSGWSSWSWSNRCRTRRSARPYSKPPQAVAEAMLVHSPAHDAEFVWRMEDVLGVYTRPYDPRRPQVCLDETSRQLLAEATPPVPVAPRAAGQAGL